MSSAIGYRTTDLCDEHPDAVVVSEPVFRDYGGARLFHGRIATVKVHEDNVLVRKTLEEPGEGRVLVVDGGGSLRCALLGDNLADMARQNGWAGLVVYGCIRDAEAIARLAIGVKALATHPRKSGKKGAGDRDVPVTFAGVTYVPGGFVYADHDGVIYAQKQLA
ncbi:ribonuclease E activity regulator RraA [Sorangium sp. So ce1335]|uniref:ribonuclease E activity regulator RraA n=1 Tax=Sorangium sp. So ce1335 TaxID=3133335 RepID=UPI003F628303